MLLKRYREEGDDISDESDFYGDDDTRQTLERKARQPLQYGFVPPVSLSALKKAKISTRPFTTRNSTCGQEDVAAFLKSRARLERTPIARWQSLEPAKLQSPESINSQQTRELVDLDEFKGHPAAWQQSGESIDDFLRRLPVAAPTTAKEGPWLWVGSSRVPRAHLRGRESEDLSAFSGGGQALLDTFRKRRSGIESAEPNKEAAAIVRKMAPYRDQLEADLLTLAVKTGITSGKWMLFPDRKSLPRVWQIVATATSEGKLGPASKVGTYKPSDHQTLICVYTHDFSDAQDVRRVLDQLVALRLCSTDGRPIYYKCDAYTHLDIKSNNEFRVRASLYSSKGLWRNWAKALKDGPVARLKKCNRTTEEFLNLIGHGDFLERC